MTGFLRRLALVIMFLPVCGLGVITLVPVMLAWGLTALVTGKNHEEWLLNPVSMFFIDLPFKLTGIKQPFDN